MRRSDLKIALRKLSKQRSYALINILGLATGINIGLLILQYIAFERSFDNFHDQGNQLYRVAMSSFESQGKEQTFAFTYPAVAPQLKKDFPEVEEAVRVRKSTLMLRRGAQLEAEQKVRFVDAPFFDLFQYQLLSGQRSGVLDAPGTVVLSESLAARFFGTEDPVGQSIDVQWYSGEWFPAEVTAVVEDEPANTHLTYDLFLPYERYKSLMNDNGVRAETSWTWSDFYTYVRLQPDADVEDLAAKLPGFVRKYKGEDMERHGYETVFKLQPVSDIHLHSNLGYEFKTNGDYRYVRFAGMIALFIMIIAWINYINLSTARSLDRAREVGVRKVLGAERRQLIVQFLTEALLLNTAAIVMAIAFFGLLLPFFGRLTGRELTNTLFSHPQMWLLMLSFLWIGAVLAGLYPAFFLSRFNPMAALRERMTAGKKTFTNLSLRKGLVVFQFTASVVLIAVSLAIYRQIQFMRQQDLGIDIEQMLVLDDNGSRDTSYTETVRSFVNELTRNPNISQVSISGDIPGKEVGQSTGLRWVNSGSEETKRVRGFAIDHRFIDNYDLELQAGRDFYDNPAADTNAVIINETALHLLGFTDAESALGEQLTNGGNSGLMRIVGVVADYHQEALKFDFKPIVFYHPEAEWQYYSLKVNTENISETLAFAEDRWNAHFPDAPFDYLFLDEFFNRQYEADVQFGRLIGLFTILAIFIACLGLFGLAAFSLSRRKKEISIRKVLGASVPGLIATLSKDYLRLLLIAGLIALPLAFWLSRKWLSQYAYQIELSWWFFVIPLGLILSIAWLTVGYQAIRSAMTNPVHALRGE